MHISVYFWDKFISTLKPLFVALNIAEMSNKNFLFLSQIFFDDSVRNIASGKAAGLHTVIVSFEWRCSIKYCKFATYLTKKSKQIKLENVTNHTLEPNNKVNLHSENKNNT